MFLLARLCFSFFWIFTTQVMVFIPSVNSQKITEPAEVKYFQMVVFLWIHFSLSPWPHTQQRNSYLRERADRNTGLTQQVFGELHCTLAPLSTSTLFYYVKVCKQPAVLAASEQRPMNVVQCQNSALLFDRPSLSPENSLGLIPCFSFGLS